MRMFIRNLKLLSYIVLFFFLWTFGPFFQIPTAIAAGKNKPSTVSHQQPKAMAQGQKANASSSERFEKALEDIRENVRKADDREGKGESVASELAAVKVERAEIETLDVDLRKQFSAMEKKLKDAKLPKEILDRHYAFVKHYDENLKELKANLDDVEKTKSDRKSFKAALDKAMLQLEKTKTPSRHIPLDPNNLPNRLVKGKRRVPRLKKKDFEKEFGPQKTKGTRTANYRVPTGSVDADSRGWMEIADSAWRRFSTPLAPHAPSSLLAFNGPAGDMSLNLGNEPDASNGEQGTGLPDLAFALNTDLSILNLATVSAVAQPTPDDLAETPEVHFTQDIKDLAAQLDHNPVKIYNWVRNNIEYAPTYGSIQGADQCLQSKICNDMDTASLLIALLRTSGIPAHYVYGTIQVPIDKAMNWVGGVTDPNMVGTIFATDGVPVTALVSGGTIKYEQIEHVWVNAFIDYIPSRGAVQKQGNTWIPLDASYKQYNYTQGIDISSAVPFDAQNFTNQILSTATTNTVDGSVTNVDSAYIQQTMTDYKTQVQDYIQQNYPNATVGDVIGKKEIVQQNYPILIGTLPYKTVQVGSEFAAVPDNLRETISFSIPDPTGATAGLSYTTGMPQVAGKRITLSYEPASDTDSSVLNSYDGDISKVPAYLLQLRPVIKVAGNTVAIGPQMGLGYSHDILMVFDEPGLASDQISSLLVAGGYNAIVLEPQNIPYSLYENSMLTFKNTLEALKAQSDTGMQPTIDRDSVIGSWLQVQGLFYFYSQGKLMHLAEGVNNVTAVRGVSEAMTSVVPSVSKVFSVPTSFDLRGYGIDVKRNLFSVFQRSAGPERTKNFMKMAGYISSIMEHRHAEILSEIPAMSTISLFAAANKAGISIYQVTKDNLVSVLPRLLEPDDVLDDIKNAASAGKIITVQASPVDYYGSMGSGYIIEDPVTGASAYRISNGANGGLQALGSCIKDIILTIYGMPFMKNATTASGTFWIAMINWAGYALDNALGSGPSADPLNDPLLGDYLGLMLISLITTMALVVLALAGAPMLALMLGIAIGTLLNYATMSLNARRDGKPIPPFWCALPCAPVLVDAYQYWFTDNFKTFVNPCY